MDLCLSPENGKYQKSLWPGSGPVHQNSCVRTKQHSGRKPKLNKVSGNPEYPRFCQSAVGGKHPLALGSDLCQWNNDWMCFWFLIFLCWNSSPGKDTAFGVFRFRLTIQQRTGPELNASCDLGSATEITFPYSYSGTWSRAQSRPILIRHN